MTAGRGRPRHPRRAADVPRLVAALERRGVRYVVCGSVAAKVHGVDLIHRDFDVVPDLDAGNLQRLFDVLRDIEASPDGFGHWETEADGRRRWIGEEATPEMLEAWAPHAGDVSSFDHLFRSRHGDFDVVPDLAGRYETLRLRAVRRSVAGLEAWVAHLDDLIASLEAADRPKHAERTRRLREIRAREATEP